MDTSLQRQLAKTAVITSPLMAAAMALPLYIAIEPGLPFLASMLLALTGISGVAWFANIQLLRLRKYLGQWSWIQIFIASALMIVASMVVYALVQAKVPDELRRLPSIRFVNVIVINTFVYIMIDLRMVSNAKAKLAQENANLHFRNLENQHRLLKEQLNPHFLFNALGTAKSLVRRDPAMAEMYIIRLSDFLRASLTQAPDVVSLKDELKLVRDFVELQQMRFRDALFYHVDLPQAWMERHVPYFSLLTLVENAIKHNRMDADEPLHIYVKADGEQMLVANTLRKKSSNEDQNGTGLHNLMERCKLLGFPTPTVTETATEFQVRIPFGSPKR